MIDLKLYTNIAPRTAHNFIKFAEGFEHKNKLKDEEVKQLKQQMQIMVEDNKRTIKQFAKYIESFRKMNVTENY